MKNKIKTQHQWMPNDPLFRSIARIYIAILLFVSCIACFFSYYQRKQAIQSDLDFTLTQLNQEYDMISDNFWQIYMPVFESRDEVYDVLAQYFSPNSTEDLPPMEQYDLIRAMKRMLERDSQVQWIAFYAENRNTNYILFRTNSGLQPLTDDFPYLEQIKGGRRPMEVYGTQPVKCRDSTLNTYAICGGTPPMMGDGKIIVGYPLATYEQLCQSAKIPLKSLHYTLRNRDQVIFHFSQSNSQDGKSLYVNSRSCFPDGTLLSYQYSPWELFFHSHRNTPAILLIVLAFALFSTFIYAVLLKQLVKEVDTIRNGLVRIGENQLTYQIPTDLRQAGLHEIAESINLMAARLNENINRAYYYEIKQKEAELSELQSKFNPHFLYNSLEMVRSRCYQSGDVKTADLITQLAAIFRGFIGSKTFIPLHEELAFSKRYLALFSARYKDQVEIFYEIDTELLHYGIIRNVFQPLIENYFVHGFESTGEGNNYICIRGCSFDARTMILTVEDNGAGMSDEDMERLNATLHEPVKIDTESYGLKNLHQRLQLFYGNDCGLTILRNPQKGLSIQMKLLKMTCEEYDASK